MIILLDADFVIRLWQVGAGSLLEDIASTYSLAMTDEVFDEIMRGRDNWLPKLRQRWETLKTSSKAQSLAWLVGDLTHKTFEELATKYAPKIADTSTPFDDKGDLVNIAWLTTSAELIYVTEDHGARYHAFLELSGVPSRITTPWALFRETYSTASGISADSLTRLKRWNNEKKGPLQRPIWWTGWLSSLVVTP
jgi:hypothetical protein